MWCETFGRAFSLLTSSESASVDLRFWDGDRPRPLLRSPSQPREAKSMRIIESFGEIRPFPPTRSLAPIWDHVSAVLRHHRFLNTDDAAIARIQQEALREGALISPSIYGGKDDVSTESFYVPHVFAYLFRHPRGDYLWLTAQLDRGYGFGVLLLPGLDLAIALYPFSVSDGLLRRLSEARASARRGAAAGAATRPMLVTGHFHMMHVLWNELSAIDRALTQEALDGCEVGHMHQPLGPLDELFPELHGRTRALPDDDAAVNAWATMPVGLGARTIPTSTRDRLRATAHKLAKPHQLSETDVFREQHRPIFWLSVKPPNRSLRDQARVLAGLMTRLRSSYSQAGFLLNGVSFPWDDATNPNYDAWFHDTMARASRGTATIIEEIYPLLEPDVRASTRIVSDVGILEEICWSRIADFYFCHGGSMQNKIAWINDVSGVIHSNSNFIASFRGMVPPTSGSAQSYFAPGTLITDDDVGQYTPLELARKDQNYAIAAIDDLAAFVIDRFRVSRG